VKVDHRINDKQNLSIYYYFDDDRTLQPFSNFELAGADVPGFGSILAERFQQWNITHTWTLTSSTVNEFRFNYNREGQGTFQHPQNTELVQESCPTAPAWLSNVTGAPPCFYGDVAGNTYGIHPFLGAGREGLPSISVSGGFSLGNDAEGELPQVGILSSGRITSPRFPATIRSSLASISVANSSINSITTTSMEALPITEGARTIL